MRMPEPVPSTRKFWLCDVSRPDHRPRQHGADERSGICRCLPLGIGKKKSSKAFQALRSIDVQMKASSILNRGATLPLGMATLLILALGPLQYTCPAAHRSARAKQKASRHQPVALMRSVETSYCLD